jgi:hypothetical protein
VVQRFRFRRAHPDQEDVVLPEFQYFRRFAARQAPRAAFACFLSARLAALLSLPLSGFVTWWATTSLAGYLVGSTLIAFLDRRGPRRASSALPPIAPIAPIRTVARGCCAMSILRANHPIVGTCRGGSRASDNDGAASAHNHHILGVAA